MRHIDPRKLTDQQLAQYRRYRGIVRVVGNTTFDRFNITMTGPKGEGTRYCLSVWRGRSITPFQSYSYRSVEARQVAIDDLVDQARRRITVQAEKATKRADARANFVNPFVPGTVLVNSWGYDQTNVDFFEVVESAGWFVTLRELSQNSKETGFMQGACQPVRGSYVSEPIRKRVQIRNDGGDPYVATKFGWLSVWDGRAKYWSSYA